MDVGPFLSWFFFSLLCSWANLNVPIAHPQTQLMDHICLHLCQRVGVTALLVRLKSPDSEYDDLPTAGHEGHLLTLCGNEAWEKFGCFVALPQPDIGFVIHPVSGVRMGARKEGAVGASDLPRAAVWVGTAAQASGGTWNGSGHHFPLFYIKPFFLWFLFKNSSPIFFIFAHFTTLQPLVHPCSSRPATMGSGA